PPTQSNHVNEQPKGGKVNLDPNRGSTARPTPDLEPGKIAHLDQALVRAQDVREFHRDVVVVAALAVDMAVAFVEVRRGLTVFTIGSVDGKAVKGPTNQGGMSSGGTGKRRAKTDGKLVIVI